MPKSGPFLTLGGGDALCNIIATVISGSRDPGRRFPSWTVEPKVEKELDLFSPRFEKGMEQTVAG